MNNNIIKFNIGDLCYAIDYGWGISKVIFLILKIGKEGYEVSYLKNTANYQDKFIGFYSPWGRNAKKFNVGDLCMSNYSEDEAVIFIIIEKLSFGYIVFYIKNRKRFPFSKIVDHDSWFAKTMKRI